MAKRHAAYAGEDRKLFQGLITDSCKSIAPGEILLIKFDQEELLKGDYRERT